MRIYINTTVDTTHQKKYVFQHHFVTYSLTYRIDLSHPGSPTTNGYFPLRSQRLPTAGFHHWHVLSLPGKLWIGILTRFLSSSKCEISSDSLDKVSNDSTERSRDELASGKIPESEKTTASRCYFLSNLTVEQEWSSRLISTSSHVTLFLKVSRSQLIKKVKKRSCKCTYSSSRWPLSRYWETSYLTTARSIEEICDERDGLCSETHVFRNRWDR